MYGNLHLALVGLSRTITRGDGTCSPGSSAMQDPRISLVDVRVRVACEPESVAAVTRSGGKAGHTDGNVDHFGR